MTSPSFAITTSAKREFGLTLGKRVLLVLLVCCIQMIYFPTSSQVTGGIEPRLPIDVVPIWPIWVVPYALCYVLWFAGFIWAIRSVDDRSFRAFIAACMLTFGIGVSTFIFFPTYIKAATIVGDDIFATYLRYIHENMGRYDAFPSGHIYITTLLALFFSRWYPRWKPVWVATVVIVALSTLFTGQHYILDVLGGYLAALAGYHFGLWWAGFYPAKERAGEPSSRRISSSLD